MDAPAAPPEVRARARAALDRLHRVLNAEIGTSGALALVGFFAPAGWVFYAAVAAALVAAPVVGHALWVLGRRGWLVALALSSGLPAVGALAASDWFWSFVLGAAALVAFFLGCVVLRYASLEWREELEWEGALASAV